MLFRSRHKPCSRVFVFPPFSIFPPYFTSYSVCFSFSKIVISRHIPGPTVCISHFPPFSVFLATMPVLHCVFLIFHVFQCFLPYFTSYSVCFSFSMIFSTLAIFQVLPCVFRIFHLFQCFLQYSRSYSVCVSFFSLFGFLASRFFSFFTFLNASRHISSPIGCVFQFSKFFSFFEIGRAHV